jgi:hypothetical protein
MSSCHLGKKGEANNIDFKEYAMDSTYHLFGDITKPAIKISLSMHYPVKYKNQAILDSLQRLVIASVTTSSNQALRDPEKAMRNFIAQLIEEYRGLEKDYEAALATKEELLSSFSNEYVGEGSNVFNKGGIFCFSSSVYRFMGGAHGLGTVKYTCVNLDNGLVITGNDLFIDDYESFLTPLILGKLVEIQGVKSPKELENDGFFDISDIKPNDNFYLNEKGIIYVYNPYEIAAYYIGILEVFIPYEDISVILAPESPVKRIMRIAG